MAPRAVVFVEPDIGVCTVWACREIHMLAPLPSNAGKAFSDDLFCSDCASYHEFQME